MSQYAFTKYIFGYNMDVFEFPMTEISISKFTYILNYDMYYHIALKSWYRFKLSPIAFKITYSFTLLLIWCFIKLFLIFVNVIDEKLVTIIDVCISWILSGEEPFLLCDVFVFLTILFIYNSGLLYFLILLYKIF